MIQDISPEIYRNHYEEKTICENDVVILVKGRDVLAKVENGQLELPSAKEVLDLEGFEADAATFLFEISGTNYFGIVDQETVFQKVSEKLEANGYSYSAFAIFRVTQPKAAAFAAITAASLYNWYRGNRFCGRCGSLMEKDHKERMMRCPSCRNMVFPKICPGVIVGVINGEKILLTRYANRPAGSNYALIAGFTEIGEPVEDTVHREVMEEAGVRVKNLKFYKSQPWCLSDTLLMGFFCEVDGDDTIHMDTEELGFASWISRDEIPKKTDEISLTAEMIGLFRDHGREVLK